MTNNMEMEKSSYEIRLDGILGYVEDQQKNNPSFRGLANACELLDISCTRYEFGSERPCSSIEIEKYDRILSMFNPFESIKAINDFYSYNKGESRNASEMTLVLAILDQIPLTNDIGELDDIDEFVRDGLISLAKQGIIEDEKDPMFGLIRELKSHVLLPKNSIVPIRTKKAKSIDLVLGIFVAKLAGVYKYIKEQDKTYIYDNHKEMADLNRFYNDLVFPLCSSCEDEHLASIYQNISEMMMFIKLRYGEKVIGSEEQREDYKEDHFLYKKQKTQ